MTNKGKEYKATARVAVTLEVTCSVWRDDCTIGQVGHQAEEDAVRRIENLIRNTGSEKGIKVIGKPVPTLVIVKEDRC